MNSNDHHQKGYTPTRRIEINMLLSGQPESTI